MYEESGLSILDALENLNTLADVDSLEEIEVTEEAQLVSHKEASPEIYWVKAGADDQTLDAIRLTFSTVHDYLQGYTKKMKNEGETARLIEGVNTIMVLVGEATKKFERYGSLFKDKITDLPEYKELQGFYRNRVVKETYNEFARAPLKRIEEIKSLIDEEVEEVAGVHILNDIEVIKRDHLYELFYLKNEAGHAFYTFELARNLKVACDFGEFAEEFFGEDPLLQIKNWEDKGLHVLAKRILKQASLRVDRFYKTALTYKEMELVMGVHNALMALMLAAYPRNLIRQFAIKGCHLYFSDFQLFLREVLESRDYQKFLAYSPPESQPFFVELMELVGTLCHALFTLGPGHEEVDRALKEITVKEEGKEKKGTPLSEFLFHSNKALTEALKKHPSGPVFNALDLVRAEDEEHVYDPLLQGNIPEPECVLKKGDHEMTLLRLPCPIRQEFIHHAAVTDEFRAFLRSSKADEVHLIINFQDRTSWREHARCQAMEDLSRQAEFANVLAVVTMAKDTDFYNQSGDYHALNEAEDFLDHFEQHLSDEASGYYFPPHVKSEFFPTFAAGLIKQIHTTFFEGKKFLTREERLDFIELAYTFVTLKLLEITSPETVTLTSKDGLDVGGSSSIALIALLGLGNKKSWKEEELDEMRYVLFGPTLLNRERVIHPERFERLHNLVLLLEGHQGYLKDFGSLFKKETLSLEPHFPYQKDEP